jgi:hypothetical protein
MRKYYLKVFYLISLKTIIYAILSSAMLHENHAVLGDKYRPLQLSEKS